MKTSLISGVLALLLITSPGAFRQQLSADQKIERTSKLLNSLETRGPAALAYVGSRRYTQHNLAVADGPRGVRDLLQHLPVGTTVHTVRIFADGDYVIAQSDFNSGDPKVGRL
jgi:predicted SnoaL-like aldol condensation-catalyzing enzyme